MSAAPGGVYNTTWFLVANPAKWAEIAPQDQATVEAVSGLAFAARVGAAWNGADAAAIEEIEAAGIEVQPASETVRAAIRDKGAALEQTWAAALGESRDGMAALARLRGMTGVSN